MSTKILTDIGLKRYDKKIKEYVAGGDGTELETATLSTIESQTSTYPEFTTSDKGKTIFGKIKKYLSDLKDNKSDIGHNHNDVYYTETEVDTKINGKQNTITGAATSITSNNLTASRVLQSDSNGKVAASGYEFDINTNNTSDTWLLVMRGSKIQHRLSTDLSVNYATSAGSASSATNATNATNASRITVTYNPTYSTPAQWGSFSGDGIKFCWFNTANKIANQPAQYGFLLHLGLTYGEGHQIWTTQANGDLYHRGFNASGNLSSTPFKKILDSSNYSSYALPLSGGNLSGSININNANGFYKINNRVATTDLGGSNFVACGNSGVYARRYDNNNTYTPMYASSFSNQSSRLVKENIQPIADDDAKKLLDIEVVSFDYIKEVGGAKNKVGMIAEDILEIYPNLVNIPEDYSEEKAKESIYNGNNTETLGLDYAKFVPYLIKLVQIQEKRIKELENLQNK